METRRSSTGAASTSGQGQQAPDPVASDPAGTLLTLLSAAGAAGVTVCLWGDPGVGKSSLVAAYAHSLNVPLEEIFGSHSEPSDFNGLPVVTPSGDLRYAPAPWATRLAAAGKGIAFVDELTTCPGSVQAAMLKFILNRRVGDLPLPDDVQVIAAANPPERAAEGYPLTPPMANRLLHLDFTPSVQEWVLGMTAGFSVPAARRVLDPTPARRDVSRATVAAFIRSRPDLLDAFPEHGRDAAAGRAWPSRRTWTMLADLIALLPTDDVDAAQLAADGLVGQGAAREFLHWRAAADLPTPAAVLADPEKAVDWSDLDPSRLWAVLAAVVAHSLSEGTTTAWVAAWEVLAVAAAQGRADVAVASAGALARVTPRNAKPPASARTFLPSLVASGVWGGQ